MTRTVERRCGGWFVVTDESRGWSGPWKNERAAKYAAKDDWANAHKAEREGDKV